MSALNSSSHTSRSNLYFIVNIILIKAVSVICAYRKLISQSRYTRRYFH